MARDWTEHFRALDSPRRSIRLEPGVRHGGTLRWEGRWRRSPQRSQPAGGIDHSSDAGCTQRPHGRPTRRWRSPHEAKVGGAAALPDQRVAAGGRARAHGRGRGARLDRSDLSDLVTVAHHHVLRLSVRRRRRASGSRFPPARPAALALPFLRGRGSRCTTSSSSCLGRRPDHPRAMLGS